MSLVLLGKSSRVRRELMKHGEWSRAELEAYQQQALAKLREHTYKNSPFYQRFHQGLANAPLSELPVLDKNTLMGNFDQLVTDRAITRKAVETHLNGLKTGGANELFMDKYWVCATSGTTGQQAYFLFNQAEWLTILANVLRMQIWTGSSLNLVKPPPVVFVTTDTPYHMSWRMVQAMKAPCIPLTHIPVTLPLAEIVKRLNEVQPAYLTSYAATLRMLVHEQKEGRLKIAPTRIISTSEVLTDETRHMVEETWGDVINNQYVTTETGPLGASTTDRKGLLMMEDLVLLEFVNDDMKPVKPGEFTSKLLVTSLYNYTEPLIRYIISDSLRPIEGTDSHGPFVLVDTIQGRNEDVLHLPSKSGGRVPIHPVAIHRVMDTVPSTGWQLVQEKDTLTLLLVGVKPGQYDQQLMERFNNLLTTYDINIAGVTVFHVTEIPKSSGGKTRLIRVVDQP